MRKKIFSILALFSSSGTLICCVLPAVVAMFAGGAAVGALISIFPWLIPLSEHKFWIFLTAGLLIGVDSIIVFWPKSKLACNITGGTGCESTSKFSKITLAVAITIFIFALFFSYALVPIMSLFTTF